MPAVKKQKPQNLKKQATPTKNAEAAKPVVVSGQLKKKLSQAKPQATSKERQERGVVLIKSLPHGFFEQQLRNYFKQFGHVTRIRLARSQRTGGSKGFAFVEFEYPEVAKVAADTMDNYLMFQKVVKATYIPPEQQKFNYFKSTVKKVKNKAGKEIFVSNLTKATQRSVQKQNNWTESACQKRTEIGMKKVRELQKKYKHLGIDVAQLIVKPVKKSKQEEAKKKELQLEDLLGNTINEDSDDEDYEISDDDEEQLQMDSDDSDEDEEELDGDEEDEEEELQPVPKKTQKQKKVNASAERMSDLIKRKPGTGGVQKKKKTTKKAATSATKLLQLAAAKKIAKPLPKKVDKKLKK
ncbi:MKI67 FHA domain-interacting nucleolar phosphoprotein [Drosophila grimshawi]|uniref:GH22444 n=1 Tax=Drosophila grimshawi TaxID=7222 RepID=B4JSH7_DROGR|nr:MKI67 FHA domain-interacting nucleolar phosphoprotein [Drosophila grimshawi]EDV94717.1 GH22444 [Drosophila grimshawi]